MFGTARHIRWRYTWADPVDLWPCIVGLPRKTPISEIMSENGSGTRVPRCGPFLVLIVGVSSGVYCRATVADRDS